MWAMCCGRGEIMPQLAQMKYCTGCGACANACPKDCISMTADAEGFHYPIVDAARCVRCGLCEKACPVIGGDFCRDNPAAYAVHNRDAEVVGSSSSGGVFAAIAEWVIGQGGVVYGAAFREDLSVSHLRVDAKECLGIFRGSKYLQSDVGSAFRCVAQDLKAGRKVLFSGTPCQAAALHRYLGRTYEELLTVDVICHSVPSPKAWRRYLDALQARERSKIVFANFRDKRDSWQGYYLCTQLENGREIVRTGEENQYMRAFLQGLSTRPSCYHCRFKGSNRGSDITLGDFWGVETAAPEAYHAAGTSLVLINSPKGQSALAGIAEKLELRPVNEAAALEGNPAYSAPSAPHPRRAEFFASLEQEEFDDLVNHLLAPTKWEKLKQRWSRSIVCRGFRKLRRLISL